MRPKYIRKKTVKFINPYTFVPTPKGQRINRDAAGAIGLDRLHTGVLHCRLYVRTPLGIPDTAEERPGENDHKVYPFFSYIENQKRIPVIPGSSLRGAIRSVFETATDSCFSTLRENTGLSKRVGNREAYKPGILKWINGNWHLYQAERYLLAVNPEILNKDGRKSNYTRYEDLPADVYVNIMQKEKDGFRIARTQSGEELRFGDLIEFRPYIEGKGIYKKNGYLIWNGVARDIRKKSTESICQNGKKVGLVYIGETFARKKHGESVFVSKGEVKELKAEQLKRAYEGLLETLEIYRNPAINRSAGHSGYQDFEHAKKETGIPLWYSIKDGKLCLASIGRTFYNTSLNELIGDRKPCTSRKQLCEACMLFGMAGEEDLGSRIRITDARAQEGYVLKKETLKILGQPRYSYLPFYARSNSGIPSSYDDGNVEIAGRKFYWHNRKAETDSSVYTTEKKTQMNSTMELMMPGAEFSFDIYYDGIMQEQLQKLMWCIHFGENRREGNLCYKIGHGKPLGLGSVKIVIEENMERNFEDGVYTWKKERITGEGEETELKRCEEIKRVMNFLGPDENIPIKYPYICDEKGQELTESGRNEDARHVWYQKNKDAERDRNDFSEVLPNIMEESQALHPYEKVLEEGYGNNFQNYGLNRR